jgi:hypothetical protein
VRRQETQVAGREEREERREREIKKSSNTDGASPRKRRVLMNAQNTGPRLPKQSGGEEGVKHGRTDEGEDKCQRKGKRDRGESEEAEKVQDDRRCNVEDPRRAPSFEIPRGRRERESEERERKMGGRETEGGQGMHCIFNSFHR